MNLGKTLGIIVLVIVIGAGTYFFVFEAIPEIKSGETQQEKIFDSPTLTTDTQVLETQSVIVTPTTSYKYNTICDIGDLEEFMIEKVWTTTMEITAGHHNDNPKLIEFFKTDRIFSQTGITPKEIFVKMESGNGDGLGPNYDPIMFDVGLWMPAALAVIDVSPELIDILRVNEDESNASYTTRIMSKINKCD